MHHTQSRLMALRAAYMPETGAGAGTNTGTGTATTGAAGGATGDQGGATAAPVTYDEWIGKQDEATKALLDTHTKGLKSALDSERASKSDLEKQLREVASKAEKGSELEQKLTKAADDLKTESTRATFYELAHAAGVTNLKLAWVAARQDDLFKKDGSPDLEALKKGYPELFGAPARSPANGGAGTGSAGAGGGGMNEAIRAATGRG